MATALTVLSAVVITTATGGGTEKLIAQNAKGVLANEPTFHESYRPTITAPAATPSTPRRFVRGSNTLAEANYASLLTSLPIKLRPGTDHRPDSRSNSISEQRCKSLVYRGLEALPQSHRNQLKDLTLFYTDDGRRGLGGEHSIVLRCLNVTDTELVGVLTHEMGHLVDSTLLAGTRSNVLSGFYDFDTPVAFDDLSLTFYRLAWESEKKRIDATSELDFVSTYAMTDPFEDFAETYAYYRLHGPEFRTLRLSSVILSKKYAFMKNYVFGGVEFGDTTREVKMDMWTRDYDVTVLPYSLKSL